MLRSGIVMGPTDERDATTDVLTGLSQRLFKRYAALFQRRLMPSRAEVDQYPVERLVCHQRGNQRQSIQAILDADAPHELHFQSARFRKDPDVSNHAGLQANARDEGAYSSMMLTMADALVEVAEASIGFAEVSDEVADVSDEVADLSDEVADVSIVVANVSDEVARASAAVADIFVEVPNASVEVVDVSIEVADI